MVNKRLIGSKSVWAASRSVGAVGTWWRRRRGEGGETLSVAAGVCKASRQIASIFVLFVQLDVELDTVEQQALD